MKKIFLAAALAFLLCTCAAATDFYEFYAVWAQNGEETATLMPSALRVTLAPGEVAELGLITRPDGLAVDWRSADEEICGVVGASSRGCTLVGNRPGECRVTVSHGDSAAAVQVVVKAPDTRLSLEPSSLSLSVGETATLRAQLYPEGEPAEIDWQISPYEDCAAISYGGNLCRIKGLGAGEFTVTAVLPGGQRALTQVRVTAPEGGNGYRLTVTLLIVGAAGLISSGFVLWRRRNEKR